MAPALERILPIITLMGIVLGWEFLIRILKTPEYNLPRPSTIVQAFQFLSLEHWLEHTWGTLRVALLAFSLSFAVALILNRT